MKKLFRWLAMAGAVALTACGSSDTTTASTSASPGATTLGAMGSPAPTSTRDAPLRAPLMSAAANAAVLDASALMNWAERTYPALFPAAGKADGVHAPYTFRRYSTDNYIAVTKEAATPTVYLYGNISGWQIQPVGTLESFTCTVFPNSCAGVQTSTASSFCNHSASAYNNSASVRLTSTVSITCNSTLRTLVGNGVPDHPTGTFPNTNNPSGITAQSYTFNSTVVPQLASASTSISHITGYANNSIPFDPATAESYNNQGVWKIEAIQNYVNLGLDSNLAHVQPGGKYHYHGIPEAYLSKLAKGAAMTLVGFAMDGFPVYARYGYSTATNASTAIKVIKGSYRLKTTADAGRPSTSAVPMGTFTQDYEYVAGLGDLDECNGRFGVTPEFPNGIYHYYLTDSYPYIQRCVKGVYTAAPTGGTGTPPR